MGIPKKRPRLATRAPKTTSQSITPTAPEPLQKTKDEKREARHDAFLKKIHDKRSTKRKRPKKRMNVNLALLETSLEDIMAEDREKRSRKMEISVKPKAKDVKKEIERMKVVMGHQEFKANPLKAIRQHVENTWEKKEGMAS